MKKKYIKAEMEITEFETEDIITNSNTGIGGTDEDVDNLEPST